MAKQIEVVPYNPLWPKQFAEEAALIQQAVGDNCIEIHHIGSTSVPGLAAKPKIDIILVVKDIAQSKASLESIGYQYRGEYNIPFHFGFSKRGDLEVNLHVYEEGNPEIELNILFRDSLRSHPEALKEYAQLKSQLLTQKASSEKKDSMFSGYNLGKDAFIRKILDQAGFNRPRLLHCTHLEEWQAAKTFRQKYFFDNVSIVDPYTGTFNHPEHIHFVFNLGTKIIGYAHFQKWPDARIALRIIVIDEPYRKQGFGSQFLTMCEKWLKSQGYKIVQAESRPDALAFYKKHEYQEMPFNDPDENESSPQDIPLGKQL